MKPLHVDISGTAFVLVWSSAYVVGAMAASAAPVLAVTLWRFVLATAVFAALAWRAGDAWPRGRRELTQVSAAGILLFGVQFGGIYLGLAAGMPAGTTALIACSSPLLVAAISAGLRWDRLGPWQWVGIALGVIGVAVSLADRVGLPSGLAAPAWTLLGLGGLTAGTLLQSRLRHSAGRYALPAVEMAAGTAVMAVWAPLHGDLAIPLTARAVGSFVWLATVAGIGGPLLLFHLISKHGATRASSRLFVVPAITALASWPLLGTPIVALTFVGLVLAAAGLRLLTVPPRRVTHSHGQRRHIPPSLITEIRHSTGLTVTSAAPRVAATRSASASIAVHTGGGSGPNASTVRVSLLPEDFGRQMPTTSPSTNSTPGRPSTGHSGL
jgi:drug/metabolite transporter (DMT)-like permease